MTDPHRHLYLAAYDVADDARRERVWRLIQSHADPTSGQRSVHPVWLTPAERDELLFTLDAMLLRPQADRFLLLRLDPRSPALLRGRAQPAARHAPELFRFD